MRSKRGLYLGVAALALLLAAAPVSLKAQTVAIDNDDIGGVVTGPNGPEAGVWVIAETAELGTKMAKMVVTDDQGRYVLPDLPKAHYKVWVRGYGLIDSQKVDAEPGKIINLTAVNAPDDAAAAQYYPAIYWYSMLKVPGQDQFPGTGPNGNGINTNIKSQGQFLDIVKTNGCVTCHQLGSKATRTIPEEFSKDFKTGYEAWTRRIQSGQAGLQMVNNMERMGTQAGLKMFGDWTDRVAKGDLPTSKPQRPQGIERNAVITVWNWSNPKAYLHDATASDKRNPTVNANGLVFGATENSTDNVPVFDPVKNTAYEIKLQVRDPKTPSEADTPMLASSAYFGTDAPWDARTVPHSLYFDQNGRVMYTARIRPPANPDFCKKGSNHPSAKEFPLNTSGRQLELYDPKTQKFTLINTCFPTHHVQFGFDADNTAWASAGGPASGVAGWVDMKVLEQTGDEQKAQGWTPFILDTNGNGKRDEYTEPNQPFDPSKDRRVNVAFYGVAPSPVDGTVWGTSLGFPGYVVRLDPTKPNPSATALAEIYEVPAPGYGPRGMDIDSHNVVWVPLASGHMASFDRTKCKVLNGPTIRDGRHCPEGWTLYPLPGPKLVGDAGNGSAEASYYTWVDQHNTLGLGNDVPFATGNENESLIALKDGKMLNFVVPYPMGFYAKTFDGRIDDPNGGWKGRGVWASAGNRTPFHVEGGKGNQPTLTKFQLRPDPLAH
ncbi:MAG TPA: carboxypeptidase-like regulatory domain-containing protein [Xanthobacteraceae bacterium]